MKHAFSKCHLKLCAELADKREKAGLSQRELSAKLKRSHTFAQYVEAGQRKLGVCEFIDYLLECKADPHEVLASLIALRKQR